MRVVGPPGSGKTLLIVALAEELRRRGHRVGSAEWRAGSTERPRDPGAADGALVLALPAGGRVTTTTPGTTDELRRLAVRLDPQLALLLVEETGSGRANDPPDGSGAPTLELVPAGGVPRTPRAELLAAVSAERLAGAFAVVGPGDTLGLAALVEERLLGAAAGRSLERTAEPPPTRPRDDRAGSIRSAALGRALGRMTRDVRARLRRLRARGGPGSGGGR